MEDSQNDDRIRPGIKEQADGDEEKRFGSF
jgi:hypothetical protein